VAVKLKGQSKVLKNLNKELKNIKNATFEGLLKGGFIIERESNKRVPIETGVLRASSYVRKNQDGKRSVVIGYSSSYAIFVHENMEMKLKGLPRQSGLGVYWGPKGEAKFLERAIAEKSKDVLEVVRITAKV
jgi:hypothetical protein